MGKTQVSFMGKLGKEERVQRAHTGKREGHTSHANMGTEIRRGDEQHAPQKEAGFIPTKVLMAVTRGGNESSKS